MTNLPDYIKDMINQSIGGSSITVNVQGSVVTERELSSMVSSNILDDLKNKTSIGLV